ncbi:MULTISPECIES: DUF2620 family protein [Terrabacteria group]|uniref:DUF2620 family protein n=1 Tax=Bacillati TaxID=1783272 RepID=UPI001C6E7EBD|nr:MULTISPECIES: DUF2620 family protein [Terrabacteria group]MBW9212984.1 DUF2620 domain-containing protein [Trueperella sp. zg.1013]
MRIAIGGLQKTVMDQTIKECMPEAETIITNDVVASKMIKNHEVDYYFGACESGGGSAISILIGLVGYSKCATVSRQASKPNRDEIKKHVTSGKICFGMTTSSIRDTVPILMNVLKENHK